ncbi:toxin-antitoxin system HicB family antitoxin [Streptomyces sp. NPDC002138]|uniref:toxin-antitoxin system HicB family antitoxin n=1 Tax=Streptomyces sp. NPDC002138 TaxID=3154410 RepID=UPI0033320510
MNSEVRVTLRLPADLHARLAAHAERERRSLNADLVYLLEGAIGPGGTEADSGRPARAARGNPDSTPA